MLHNTDVQNDINLLRRFKSKTLRKLWTSNGGEWTENKKILRGDGKPI